MVEAEQIIAATSQAEATESQLEQIDFEAMDIEDLFHKLEIDIT